MYLPSLKMTVLLGIAVPPEITRINVQRVTGPPLFLCRYVLNVIQCPKIYLMVLDI